MTDHLDRDLHPVKEDSSIDTCHCSIDPRERHIVCKLDRYELEDRYLRLLEEVNSLKKLSNSQEDKIKRLATKLMRYGVNPRTCIATVDVTNDRERLLHLENENSKLKNQMCILRNQLMNNKIFARSPPRVRRLGSTSGLITCRSEGSRLKTPSCQCINIRCGNDEHDIQNYSLKMQEIEKEKKEMMSRIGDLETELATYTSGNQRDKVAENIEYIRIWRQMKRQNEKLIDSQSANEILNEQICQLKSRLEESNKNNVQVNAALEAEKIQVAQMDESILKVKSSEVDMREKDERIIDLINEIKILQQHNSELLDLSSKFDNVEHENDEFKRKIAQQASEQLILKDNIIKEKANVLAFKAANEQLLFKLNELQSNIDLMNIELTSQNKCKINSKNDKQSILNKQALNINSENRKKEFVDSKITEPVKHEKGIQAGEEDHLINESTQTEHFLDSAKTNEKASDDHDELYDENKIQVPRNGNLSRKGMLRLLDQVQINTPLESQNTTRIRHSGTSALSNKSRKQVSKLETLLFGDSCF
ncbi:PREDICTED: protein fantom-like [Ceratosolen solmsi marchali]|uniref:Protein fantom-like n=1 Tax=Ceratosolen solmsi marchali TaxID=326594 RepID=A0AAJ6YUQ5_9HYME|nr:PREDICTED: protein fantom-like [Ceratosolen solmsi marchali]